jgi:hypothetical protein
VNRLTSVRVPEGPVPTRLRCSLRSPCCTRRQSGRLRVGASATFALLDKVAQIRNLTGNRMRIRANSAVVIFGIGEPMSPPKADRADLTAIITTTARSGMPSIATHDAIGGPRDIHPANRAMAGCRAPGIASALTDATDARRAEYRRPMPDIGTMWHLAPGKPTQVLHGSETDMTAALGSEER